MKAPMRGTSRKAAVGIAAVVAAVGASEALAGGQIKTTAKLKTVEPEGASGKVKSPNPKCERGRKVTLFFDQPEGAQDLKAGTDKTNRKGKFEIEESLFAGTYYVKVSKKKINKKKTCKRAKSARLKG